jgi:hypothetical protein
MIMNGVFHLKFYNVPKEDNWVIFHGRFLKSLLRRVLYPTCIPTISIAMPSQFLKLLQYNATKILNNVLVLGFLDEKGR